MWLLALLACSGQEEPSTPAAAAGTRILAHPGEVSVELPNASRPADELAGPDVALAGPWKLRRSVGGVDELEMPLPVRPFEFPVRQAPLDLSVADGATKVAFETFEAAAPKAGTWGLDGTAMLVRVPAGTQPSAGLRLACARAYERERLLHLSTAGLAANEFAVRTLRVGNESRTGLLLPPPGKATWEVDVPTGGVLRFDGSVLPPEVAAGTPSDGATVVVTAEADGQRAEIGRIEVATGAWTAARFELAAFAGKRSKITFTTEPGATDHLDYVFLAAPTVYVPKAKPKRAVVVFVDTLRRDHLGVYGYGRPTSPKLDAWAKDAVVFDQARTVAPWTLPSARAILSGRQPERWGEVATFPDLLGARGYLPVAVVANHLLTDSFGMAEGWAYHNYLGDVMAEETVSVALDTLAKHPDEDVAMLLHVMDPHMPYREPKELRRTWAGDDPPGLTGLFNRAAVDALRLHAKTPEEAAPAKQYLVDRYDQEILYTDGQLARLFEALGPDATIIFVSDHGEEFFEHGGFEHGHTLYDELLRIPLIVKSPGLAPGRVAAPVQNMDVLPTLLDLLGKPEEGLDGRSLVAAAKGDAEATNALEARALVFGRKYYGRDRWGVLSGGRKWTTGDGVQSLFDLAADPGEKTDLAPTVPLEELDPYRAKLGETLGKDTPYVWRLVTTPFRQPIDKDVRLRVEHPSGIARAWRGYDWKGTKSEFVVEIAVKDGVAEFLQPAGQLAPAELFILPNGDPRDPRGLKVTSDVGGTVVEATFANDRKPPPVKANQQTAYAKPFNGDVRWALDLAITPVLDAATGSDFNPDSLEELKALGYVQ